MFLVWSVCLLVGWLVWLFQHARVEHGPRKGLLNLTKCVSFSPTLGDTAFGLGGRLRSTMPHSLKSSRRQFIVRKPSQWRNTKTSLGIYTNM